MLVFSMLPSFVFFLMIRLPPRSTRTETRFPYTTLFRSTGDTIASSLLANALISVDFPALGGPAITTESPSAITSAAGRSSHSPSSPPAPRSEEHTSELQSLTRISYAVFCLKKKNTNINYNTSSHHIHKKNNTTKLL